MRHKLLFLDQFGYLGGGQRVLLETLKCLDRARYEPTVALGTTGDFRDGLLEAGIPVLDLPLGTYRSMEKTWRDIVRFFFRSFYCVLVLIRWIVRHRPHLLFANGPRMFVCATLAGFLTRRPVIWHLHNVLPQGVELSLLAVFARWVRAIVACSQAAARPLVEARPRLRGKIRVVYNPVPILKPPVPANVLRLRERFGLRPGQVCIGIFGRVTPFKGQWHFLRAARLVLEQSDRACFFVVGSPAPEKADQEYYSQLRATVEECGMKSHVCFIEHRSEIEEYLGMMDIVVVASQGPEAFPQTVVEAMSMGKAIVAPGTGGIVEMLEDGKTGLFAHVKQPNHLAAAMLKLIDDGETRRSIGRNAQQEVSQVDSRRAFAEAIQLTIENCLAREGTRVAVSPAPPCTKGATL